MNSFPEVWEAAKILSDDSAALAKWNSISANIPTNIPQKVFSHSGLSVQCSHIQQTQPPPSSYSSSDPDCWWTYGQCTTPKLADLPPDITAAPEPPYGDVDDRIRAIANALGLQTIMWEYDTADASVDGKTITDQTVVDNYNSFIQKAEGGAFNSVCSERSPALRLYSSRSFRLGPFY
ncbi:hypothetical protein HHX47_DHR6000700 [Lentinula edodes]|nr:hypothetical protein HHX47_DHR6000700 [Lentinula edodes]